jgi:general secretion pathway protein D
MGTYRFLRTVAAILVLGLSFGGIALAEEKEPQQPAPRQKESPQAGNQEGNQQAGEGELNFPDFPDSEETSPEWPQAEQPQPQAQPPTPQAPSPGAVQQPVPPRVPGQPAAPYRPTPLQATPYRPTPGRPMNLETNNEISINFDNAPVLEVLDVMSRLTGKNFVIDPAVKGTVTVIAPKKVPKAEAYDIFQSILELNGFSLVPMGTITKVVPSRTATQKSIPVSIGREAAEIQEGDQVVTQLIPIKYTDAQAIVTVLTPLISRDASMAAYANTNMIVLTDTMSNIKRLLKIIEEIDVPGFEQVITIIPLVNAQADTLAQEILQALEPGAPGMAVSPAARTRRAVAPAQPVMAGAASTQIKIIPDARTNSLVVVANELDTEQVRFLATELDKTTPIEANNIHVYRLKNALAEDVAKVLTNLAATTAPAGQPGSAPVATSGVRTFYKEVSIVPDKTTNSLIITATPQDYIVIKEVIDQLDVMRPQVLVETLIAEVSLNLTRNLGIQWLAANPNGQDHGFAGVNQNTRDQTLAANVAAALAAGAVPAVPGGMSVGYFLTDDDILKAFIELNADESNNDINVLSAPHVLTLDNQKATINISDNVPFITSRLTDNTGTTTTLAQSETFEFRDVGIILEITPHISPDRMVRLELVQKVNDVATVDAGGTTGIVLSERKREVQTTVVVKDRHTLVLGGLMKDSDTDNVSEIPFLGDIPVLGWMFKNNHRDRTKTNLLIFITPSIVANVAEAGELTNRKRGESGERLQERIGESPTIQRNDAGAEDAPPLNSQIQEVGPK